MAMKRCRKCGSPIMLARSYKWPGDGTIVSRNDPASRMTIFEAGYYPHVWSELEERLGFPVAEVVLKSQRLAMRDYLESHIIYGWRKYALKAMSIRPVILRVIDQTSLFGFGRLEITEYRRHRMLMIRIRDPFDIISIVGGIRGIFETIEGLGSEMAWRRENDDYIVTLVPRTGEDKGADSMEALRALREAKRNISGDPIPCERTMIEPCPSCGLPLGLSELEWREDECIIHLRQRGIRYIMTTGYIFLGTIRELEKRSGQDLEPVILEISRDYNRGILRGVPIRTRGGAYRAAAGYISVAGYGEVVRSSHGEGHLEMTIVNPYYPPRLVGRIAGLFEHVEGEEAKINYHSPEPQVLELELTTT